MDANREGVEFQDWEVLQNSEDVSPVVDFVGIESDSDGVIRSDYFSLEGQTRYAKTDADAEGDQGSVESDNPSWIDPAPFGTKKSISTEFWSDSSTDPSEDRKFPDFDATNEPSPREMEAQHNKLTGLDESSFMEKCFSDSAGDDVIIEPGYGNKDAKMLESSEFSSTGELNDHGGLDEEHSAVAAVELKSGGEGEKRRTVWWKVPFELIKYCVVRVSPVWSFSVAAAFVAFIILGRRLYKMKRKSQSLKLKVALDDKKVSQFMGHAARLNEAFSVVRRVPIIRPSLPASGVTPWPVMSMR